jgi:hypothetical protein
VRGDGKELGHTFYILRCGGQSIVECGQLSGTTSLEDAVVENRRIVGDCHRERAWRGSLDSVAKVQCSAREADETYRTDSQNARTPRSESERANKREHLQLQQPPVIAGTPEKIGARAIHCCNNAIHIPGAAWWPSTSTFSDFQRQSVPLFRVFMGLGIGAERACLECFGEIEWESGETPIRGRGC